MYQLELVLKTVEMLGLRVLMISSVIMWNAVNIRHVHRMFTPAFFCVSKPASSTPKFPEQLDSLGVIVK